jgi:hypothetical protein
MQATAQSTSNGVEIGKGLFLETVPAVYITVNEKSDPPPTSVEWVTIPATFETVTETVVVQKAYSKLEVIPPIYDLDGALNTPARAIVQEVPAVTKQVSRRVVKTPSRVVKRSVPVMCNLPQTRRVISEKAAYIIRNASGEEIERFESPSKVADFINSR